MRIFLVCVALLIATLKFTYGDLPDEHLTWADRQCITEQNLDREMIQKAFGEGLILEEGNPIINGFVECTYKKTYYMNNDGSLNFRNIRAWAMNFFYALNTPGYVPNKNAIVDKAISECETIKGDNPGDTGVKTFNCLIGFIKESTTTTTTTSNSNSER